MLHLIVACIYMYMCIPKVSSSKPFVWNQSQRMGIFVSFVQNNVYFIFITQFTEFSVVIVKIGCTKSIHVFWNQTLKGGQQTVLTSSVSVACMVDRIISLIFMVLKAKFLCCMAFFSVSSICLHFWVFFLVFMCFLVTQHVQ